MFTIKNKSSKYENVCARIMLGRFTNEKTYGLVYGYNKGTVLYSADLKKIIQFFFFNSLINFISYLNAVIF